MEISKTRRMTESAVMIALATVLSYIPVISLPFGGSVTVFSQVPIVVMGYRHGAKWGAFMGVVHGLLQMVLQGLGNFSYVKGAGAYIILIFMDYIIAFGALGLGGALFRKLENQPKGIALGAATASLMRYACHFVSGVTIWREYASGFDTVWLYSLVYNGSYMIPELAVTVIGTAAAALALDLKSSQLIRRRKNI